MKIKWLALVTLLAALIPGCESSTSNRDEFAKIQVDRRLVG